MTNDEAKFILEAYRPSGRDAADPRFAEALERARVDAELRAWFEVQQAFDRAVATKLAQAPVPPDLADRILAGRAALNGPPRPRLPVWFGIAAILALWLTGWLWWQPSRAPAPEGTLARYTEDMTRMVAEFPRLDMRTEQVAEMESWLRAQPSLAAASIPASLRAFPGLGCRQMVWNGRTVGLLCFAIEGEIVHVFVIPDESLEQALETGTARFARRGGWTSGIWAAGGHTYLALTHGKEDWLRRHLRV